MIKNMEKLNKTPTTGKFGDVAKVLDTNFGLIVTKLMELSEAKKMNCGFYSSEAKLKTAYPNPDKGMMAYVGSGTDYTVYRCKTDGTWTATSETFKVDTSADFNDINDQLSGLANKSKELENKKADAEQVNNSLYDLEKKIGDRVVVEGDVTNLPDEEDLTSVKESERDVLKLADRSYAPEKFSGKGYKILRRNIQPVSVSITKIRVESIPSSDGTLSFFINGKETSVSVSASIDNTTSLVAQKIAAALNNTMTEYEVSIDASLITLTRKLSGSVTPSSYSASSTEIICTINDNTKVELRNILKQTMFNQPNTTYEIRYDFILDSYIRMPHNTTLFFNGGKIIRNGQLIYGAKIDSATNEKIKVLYNNIDGDDSIYKLDVNMMYGNIINVLDFNFDNTGTYDISDALQKLLDRFTAKKELRSVTIFFPRGIYKVTKPIITKTSNITLLGESFSVKNFGDSFSQASVINFVPKGDNMTLFPSTTYGINLKNLVFEGNSAKITTNTNIWNGTDAQHYKLYSETKTNISCVVLRSANVIDNCAFSGFSGCAVFTGIFGELNNSYITNCNIGINSISPDVSYYTADFSVNNSVITSCNIGVICNNTFYIKNSWIDECCKYGITNFYGSKIVISNLKVLNSHMNHIDFNGINLKSLSSVNFNTLVVSGCTFNRTNCYYAGYTYDNVENKEHCSTIYAENLKYSFIQFAQYYGMLSDSHTGGRCSIVPILASKMISDNVIFISGMSQQKVPIITLNDTTIGDNNINYNSKKYNLNKLMYEDDILNTGDSSKRPIKADIGFIYKDTTLDKLIIWDGNKWVNLDGTELS